MKMVLDFMAEVAALQAEMQALREASKKAEADGDTAALDALIAQAIANRKKIEALLAKAKTAQAGLNRKTRRMQTAARRKAH